MRGASSCHPMKEPTMNASELPRKVGPLLATLLLLLTVFGPISMDLYLPVLPALTADLGTVTSMAQLTLTSCLIGLAVGQIIAGPISDRYGRMRPLLVGLVAYIAASVLCALSPSVETLIFARLIQGLAGSVGIVIAQAAGRDVYEGGALIRFYGRVTVIGGLAAIVGPVIGGQLALILDWRGIFLFLAGLGVLIMAATLLIYRETLPKKLRSTGGAKQSGNDFRKLLTDRVFIGAVLICGLTHAALFAYLSGATYILQDGYGLSPQGYALAFGANSAGYMIFGAIAGRTADRWSERGTLAVGVTMTGAGAVGLLATGLWSLPLPVILGSLFVMASGVAFAAPPSASLALAGYPELAGTASSVLGLSRFGLGAIAAPLVGIAGPTAVTPLGIITVLCVVLSALCLAMVNSQSSVLQRVNAQ